MELINKRTLILILIFSPPFTILSQNSPPGGISLIGNNFPSSFKLYSGSAEASKKERSITGQPFKKVVELNTKKKTDNFWGAEYRALIENPVKKNGAALLRFYIRCTSSQKQDSTGVIQVYCQKATPNWDKSLSKRIIVATKWKEYLIPFTFDKSYQPDSAMLAFGLGASPPQTIQLAAVELLYYGSKVSVEELPKTGETYAGRNSDATWRIEAQNRINKIRKGDFTIRLRDINNLPIPNAEINIEQLQHSFQFGSAVALWRLVSQQSENKIYQNKFLELFNAGGPENSLKWQPWIGDWGSNHFGKIVALRGLRWLKQKNIPTRGHVMVWPGWDNLPALVSKQRNNPDPIPNIILKHIEDISKPTLKYVYEWDVLNEPYSNHDLMDIFGKKIMIDWFNEARKHNPDSLLYLNDYGILTEGGMNTAHQNDYEETCLFLLKNKAPLTGLGFQGHFTPPLTSPKTILRILDRYSKLGLPIKITEFDVDTKDESLQADFTRDFLYAAFSHPSVRGIQFWGFWGKQHWKPNAALYTSNWREKPNGKILKNLTKEKWWTKEKGISNQTGLFTRRAFYGDYQIDTSFNGKKFESKFTFNHDKEIIDIRMEAIDLRPKFFIRATGNNKLKLMFTNNSSVKYLLQKSTNLNSWVNMPVEMTSNKSRYTIEIPLSKAASFYRLISNSP